MNKKIINIVILICSFWLVFSLISNVYAVTSDDINVFSGDLTNVTSGKTVIQNVIGAVLSVVRIVGAAIAIIILIVIACKYIIASAGDRADIKKYAFNYIIGALILFAASGVLGIVQNMVNDLLGEPATTAPSSGVSA